MVNKTLILTSGTSGSTKKAGRLILSDIGGSAEEYYISDINDLSGYDRIIICSPIYYGKWSKETEAFIEKFKDKLRKKEVFIFFTCLRLTRTGKEIYCETKIYIDPNLNEILKEKDKMKMMEKSHSIDYYLNPLKDKLELVKPKSIGFFKGNLIFKKLDFKSRLVMKIMSFFMEQVKQGEYLNENAIKEWLDLNKIVQSR